ncbi:cysteine desulfurase family protein [Chenggangzhangella methanolivorans]|uniref:Cysteine desulfurase n=1 Tax=Chenggangzhangella methanolivorans TaxID=1437009 RepID=A0A9E6UPR9_9HYPH|nr:cysteine desulfurase family protein [Chenggangzhangella methanolivorans]QZO00080.1 cysteine desulfurase [Chenggangzhangella methanolivorans]
MTVARVYLDHNATTATRPSVAAAMADVLAATGNPSSVHAEGRAKRALVEEARRKVAALVGADAACVTFTSGGTEASNLALTPTIRDSRDLRRVTRLAVSAVEHPAVAAGARFPSAAVETIPVDGRGVVDLQAVEAAFARHASVHPDERMILALMAANNETGVIQPVAEAAAIAKRHGGLVHVDAVQAAGKIPVDIGELGCDFLAIAAHKFGGPAGVGALARAHEGLSVDEPLVRGGGQEKGWRGGTENVAGFVGMGVAAEEAAGLEAFADLAQVRDALEAGLRALGDLTVFGEGVSRLPNTSCFAVRGLSSANAMIALDLAGIAVSAGSACSSGKTKASPVLDAMGIDHDLSTGMLRVSFGWSSGAQDGEAFLKAWTPIVARRKPGAVMTAA